MKYMTTNEASKKWDLSDRRIRVLCTEGKIEGALKIGRNWSIPADANKPVDGRTKITTEYIGLDFDFTEHTSLKKKIDVNRPFKETQSKTLRDNLIVEWTYNSNAIEGNTLTMSETKVVLEGITIGGKSVVEHLEAINHRDAIVFIETLLDKNEVITEWNIKNIHQLILKDIDNLNAGKYRNENVLISGAKHIPPNHIIVSDQMQKLVYEMQTSWSNYHPIVKATLLHGEFVKVHPFIDGNGRTARLLLNFELMRNGYPPVVIKKENRLEYYDALDTAHTTYDYTKFIGLVSDLVLESERLWLHVLS